MSVQTYPKRTGVLPEFHPEISKVKSIASANYTVPAGIGANLLFITTGASNRTITLPPAAAEPGRCIFFKKVDTGAGTVTIDANLSETIDEALTFVMRTRSMSVLIVSDGVNWKISRKGLEVVDMSSPAYGFSTAGTGATGRHIIIKDDHLVSVTSTITSGTGPASAMSPDSSTAPAWANPIGQCIDISAVNNTGNSLHFFAAAVGGVTFYNRPLNNGADYLTSTSFANGLTVWGAMSYAV